MVICVPGGMVFAAAPSGPAAIADPVARPAVKIIANTNFSANFIFFTARSLRSKSLQEPTSPAGDLTVNWNFPLLFQSLYRPDDLSLQVVQPVSVHGVFQRYWEECTVSGLQEGKPWIGNLRWLPDPSTRV